MKKLIFSATVLAVVLPLISVDAIAKPRLEKRDTVPKTFRGVWCNPKEWTNVVEVRGHEVYIADTGRGGFVHSVKAVSPNELRVTVNDYSQNRGSAVPVFYPYTVRLVITGNGKNRKLSANGARPVQYCESASENYY